MTNQRKREQLNLRAFHFFIFLLSIIHNEFFLIGGSSDWNGGEKKVEMSDVYMNSAKLSDTCSTMLQIEIEKCKKFEHKSQLNDSHSIPYFLHGCLDNLNKVPDSHFSIQ